MQRGDGAYAAAKPAVGGDVRNPFAVDPDFAAIAQTREVSRAAPGAAINDDSRE